MTIYAATLAETAEARKAENRFIMKGKQEGEKSEDEGMPHSGGHRGRERRLGMPCQNQLPPPCVGVTLKRLNCEGTSRWLFFPVYVTVPAAPR